MVRSHPAFVACALLAVAGLASSCSSGAPASTASTPVTVTVTSATTPSEAAVSTSSTTTSTPTPATTSLQEAFDLNRSGVVRIEVATCDDESIGSGFAIGDDLVVTAAHVVEAGQVIRLIEGTKATAGTVIGEDDRVDVALIRTATPLAGRALTLSPNQVRVGDAVAAIGFPQGDPLTFNPGTVNGLDRKVVIDDMPRVRLLELDAATAPGSSGGPVVATNGDVVGLVDAGPQNGSAGRRYAVASSVASPLVSRWASHPEPPRRPECTSVAGPDGATLAASESPTSSERQAISTIASYFNAINQGDFPTALAQLRHPGSLADFKKATESSHDSDFALVSVGEVAGHPIVDLEFTSEQDPGQGPAGRPDETCTVWSIRYGFALHSGLWLIDSAKASPGGPASRPCETGD